MAFHKTFVLLDDGSFVKSFDLHQQKLAMTQDGSEAQSFTLSDDLEVAERLGYLAAEKLVLKVVEGTARSR